MVSPWNLRNTKYPLVSGTLLNILADLNNAVVLMVSIRPPMFSSSRPCSKLLDTVSGALITIGVTVAFMLHSLFRSLAMSKYLSLFIFFDFHSVVHQKGKVH